MSLLGEPIDTVYLVDNSEVPAEQKKTVELADKLRNQHVPFQLQVVVNPVNLGFAKSINNIVETTQNPQPGFEYYLLLNNDAQVTPGMIKKMVHVIENDSEVMLVGAENGEHGCHTWYHRVFGITTKNRTRNSIPYLPGSCLLVRGSLVKDTPLFNEQFFMYGEDVLLSWKVDLLGGKSVCAPGTRLIHEGTGSSRKGGLFYEYHVARGHLLIAENTARNKVELLYLLICRMVYLLPRSVVRSIRLRTGIPLLAFLICWFDLPIRPPVNSI